MKPDGGQPQNRRAAMYLAQLAWLDGFPLPSDDGRWHVLGGVATTIAGQTIATSRRAARTLLRDHRDELAERVGDVYRWWTIVDAKLAWCSKPTTPAELASRLIETLPSRVARQTRALAAGDIAPAIHAAVVAWVGAPADLAHGVAWLVDRPGVMIRGLAMAVELASLAVLAGDAGIDAILALEAVDAPDPELARKRASTIFEMVKGNLEGQSWPLLPTRVTWFVTQWLHRLVVRPPDIKRRYMKLAAVAKLAEAMQPWRDWFDAHEGTLQRAMGRPSRGLEDGWKTFVDKIGEMENVVSARPKLEINVYEVLGDIGLIARFELHTKVVGRLVEHLPADWDIAYRARLLCYCATSCAMEEADEPVALLWDAMVDQLDHGGNPRVYQLFAAPLDGARISYVETELFDHKPSRPKVRRWATLFARLADPSSIRAHLVAMWIQAKLDDDTIVGVVDATAVRHHSFPVSLARVAIAISDGSVADLHAMYEALHAASITEAPAQAALVSLAERAARDGASWILREAITKQPDVVATLAALAQLVPATKIPSWTSASPSRDTAWIDRYPGSLRPVLARLASLRDDAESAVAKRLHDDIPDPAALRVEIATLRARDSLSASLAKRLANLERRLGSPTPPSDARIAKHVAALDTLAVTWGMTDMTAAITRLVVVRIETAFGLVPWPGWTLDRLTLRILTALLELGDDQRALAARLLRARLGPSPWDLRDEPANRAVIQRMRDRGVVMEPWLDDSATTAAASDGTTIELAFTSDPLEVFAMGAHFETCLAPGEYNFFSAVTNAADINKRVVYARRDGAVVGRCLYALNDRGELLAFHPYAHSNQLGFEAIVRDHIASLAERMHTTTARAGTVALVLARRWYDDGPLALTGHSELPALELHNVKPSELVAELREALGTLDAVTLPYAINDYELVRRPELIVPLIPFLLRAHVDGQTMVKAAFLAWRAGEYDVVDHLIGDHERLMSIEFPTSAPLAVLRPSRALALLRATRRRHVRSWRDDDPERQATAALAFAALHRPHQAAALAALVRRGRDDVGRDLDHELAQLATRTA